MFLGRPRTHELLTRLFHCGRRYLGFGVFYDARTNGSIFSNETAILSQTFLAESMVQKWIKCCSDASVCCIEHLKDDLPTEAAGTVSATSPVLNLVDDYSDRGFDYASRQSAKRSTKSPPKPRSSLSSLWDVRAVGEEELIVTPDSVTTSADGSVHHISSFISSPLPLSSPSPDAHRLRCPRTWDGWSCWNEDVEVGVTVEQPCPEHIYWKITAPPCRGQSHFRCLAS